MKKRKDCKTEAQETERADRKSEAEEIGRLERKCLKKQKEQRELV